MTDPDVGVTAQLACLLEASAPKPGNVTPARGFPDARYEDFLASAAAIGPAMAAAGDRSVGATILAAVRDTRRRVRVNTNLGIILLLAPLAKAAATCGACLRAGLRSVLEALSITDAAEAYTAIREAAPGGLGEVPEQDVRWRPTVDLREAMRLAADRDSIAREYATGFDVTFERTVPALAAARESGMEWPRAVAQAYLEVLARLPDTHLVRKAGRRAAEEASRLARDVLDAGGMSTAEGRRAAEAMDRELRGGQVPRNPGTTADLLAAGLFVHLWTREEMI